MILMLVHVVHLGTKFLPYVLMEVPLFEMLIQFAKVMTKKLASPYLVSYPTLHQESDK